MSDAHEGGGAVSACTTRMPKRMAQVLLVALLLGIVGAWMAQSKPGWWQPPPGALRGGAMSPMSAMSATGAADVRAQSTGAATADDRARALESGLASELSRVRPEREAWAIRVQCDDANAWLALRLPQWLAHDRELPWPKGVDLVQVSFAAPDRVTLGAERGGWIWSATVRVLLREGQLSLEPVGGALGKLWIPWLSAAAPSPASDSDAANDGALSLAAFIPELAQPVEALIPLPDGRRVRLLDFEFDDREVRLRFETLPR